MKTHQKHASIPKPDLGEYGRSELAILGAPCAAITTLVQSLIKALSPIYKVAYVDADHQKSAGNQDLNELHAGADMMFTDKISFRRMDSKLAPNTFQQRLLFNSQDLVLVNGNHFLAKHQVVIIDPAKPLEKKLDRLTDVRLILLKDKNTSIPDYLQAHLPYIDEVPVYTLDETATIENFMRSFMKQQVSTLNGLILAGGKSQRMQQDKSMLDYNGNPQREHIRQLLGTRCDKVFLSCNQDQYKQLPNTNLAIKDAFLGIGPMGGILSAFQQYPDRAWLTLACDLPFVTEETLQFLVKNRNPSKLATAFYDPEGRFPEPLVTIWEPRSYPVLLQFLAQGYTCPRKVLINSDVELLTAPDATQLQNINLPEEYAQAKAILKPKAVAG